jgi:hypothetical protein
MEESDGRINLPIIRRVDYTNGLIYKEGEFAISISSEYANNMRVLYMKAYHEGSPKDRMAYETRCVPFLRYILEPYFECFNDFQEIGKEWEFTSC